MQANVNRDTGHLATAGGSRDELPKPVLRTETGLETASPPFRYYYTTRHPKAPCSTIWSPSGRAGK